MHRDRSASPTDTRMLRDSPFARIASAACLLFKGLGFRPFASSVRLRFLGRINSVTTNRRRDSTATAAPRSRSLCSAGRLTGYADPYAQPGWLGQLCRFWVFLGRNSLWYSCSMLGHQGYTQPGYSQMDYGAPTYGQDVPYQQRQGMSSGGLTVSRREDSVKKAPKSHASSTSKARRWRWRVLVA